MENPNLSGKIGQYSAPVQLITPRDFVDSIFDAQVVDGRIRQCGFYFEKWKMIFAQEDLVVIDFFGTRVNVLVLQITPVDGHKVYVKCLVKGIE